MTESPDRESKDHTRQVQKGDDAYADGEGGEVEQVGQGVRRLIPRAHLRPTLGTGRRANMKSA
jgi:hypothetical protein